MGNGNNFDIPALLKMGCLDIRRIAKTYPSMQVGEYFGLLTKFINQWALINRTLERIAAQKSEDRDFHNMSEIKTLIADLGYDNPISAIDDIINVGRRGHHKSAADQAKKVLDDLNGLFNQITEAKKKSEKTKSDEEQSADKQFPIETQLLSKVINLLDHEEATRKLRVLAIDDAPSIIKTISDVLSDEYQVYGISKSKMLEKFLQQITPDLFLLDYEMPELSGFDLVPIIRGFKDHKDTPIIFLTSSGTTDHVSAAYALGACDFIVKPFQDTILREKVAKHIVRKKLF